MSNHLELRHIKYFLAVAEELHFRKAAEKLFISQPGLSRQIKQMEEDLGFKLFERNNKNVTFTKEGEFLFAEFKLTLKNIDDIVEHAKLLKTGIEGSINFGYVGSAMQNVIPKLLLKFRNKHKSIKFVLNEMENQKQIEALLKNEIDIGFVRLDKVPSQLIIKPVYEDTFSLVLPKKHKINKRNFRNLSQLKDESFILFDQSYSPSYYTRVMQIFEHSKFTPNISHNSVHAGTIFRLVENNFGVSIVPTSLSFGYNMEIKFIELVKNPHKTILSAIWNKKSRNPVLERLLKSL